MLIQCLVERDGPSVATIMGHTYAFKEQSDGAKVCDVNNGGDRERMLSMPALYKVYRPKSGSGPKMPPEPGAPVVPEIPDFNTMDADAIRVWARDNIGFAVRGNLGKERAAEVVRHELRCKGWIA